MENMPMGSLEDYLYTDSNADLLEAEIQHITRQLLEGLSYLHSVRIIHRDVKGANVLLQKKFIVKLTDFGVSKMLLDQSKAKTSYVGTLRWMAPELLSPQSYTNVVDIWSLGCTILQMVNRTFPFDDLPEEQMVIFRLGGDNPSPAYRLKANCSQHLKDFIYKTLNKDPRNRPAADTLLKGNPFIVPIAFETEGPSPLDEYNGQCPKYPDHKSFIPIKVFNINHLPDGYHDVNIVDLIKAISDLTLKIVNRQHGTPRLGSGYVYRVDTKIDSKCQCHKCQVSETPSMCWFECVVITATSVVSEGIEAGNVQCQVLFDDTTSQSLTLDGFHVLDANIETQRCIMKCATCNKDMIDMIRIKLEEAENLRGKLMQLYFKRKDIHTLTIIISHPHGLTKHVTVGDWVKKFEIEQSIGVEQSSYTYTTPTCPGSSGAPVFILSRVDHKGYHTHSGFDKKKSKGFSGTWIG